MGGCGQCGWRWRVASSNAVVFFKNFFFSPVGITRNDRGGRAVICLFGKQAAKQRRPPSLHVGLLASRKHHENKMFVLVSTSPPPTPLLLYSIECLQYEMLFIVVVVASLKTPTRIAHCKRRRPFRMWRHTARCSPRAIQMPPFQPFHHQIIIMQVEGTLSIVHRMQLSEALENPSCDF